MLSGFSWEYVSIRCPLARGLAVLSRFTSPPDLPGEHKATRFNALFRQCAGFPLLRHHIARNRGNGIFTVCPSDPPCGCSLGPTYPDPISVDQEPLVFRREGFAPSLSLLIPTFAFPIPPAWLAPHLHRATECSLPTVGPAHRSMASAAGLMPAYYPCGITRLVSCYALFK